MVYKIILTEGEDGYLVAECPAISGCISQGKTLPEALKNIKEAIELALECYKEEGKPIPEDHTKVEEIAV
ncbi:MAG: type II toxin-antitoxin system HicB family antitoxin [Planctomycetes bacterium]|nr:type II toxin-antitoxin system HicB family antitoxin [Planctomycetota bacterium]